MEPRSAATAFAPSLRMRRETVRAFGYSFICLQHGCNSVGARAPETAPDCNKFQDERLPSDNQSMTRRTAAAVITSTMAPSLYAQPQRLRAHPRLLFDAAGIARLKQRVEATPWSERWLRLRASVDRGLSEKIELPPRGGNWAHWYVCPKHGARLTTGKRIGPWQWEHICPVDGEILHGDPSRADRDFDGVTINNTHSRYASAVRDAGILFQVTGEPQYADRARDIL